MSSIDWENGEIQQPESASTGETDWDSGALSEPAEAKGFTGHLKDLGLSAAKSVISVPEAAVGLGDVITGGKTGKAAERLGFRPKEAKEFVSEFHTDKYKEQQQEFQQADGIIDKTAVALQNPSMIAGAVVESIAPMFAGGAAARGIKAMAPASSAVAAGATGEGLSMTGSQAEQIRQETDDGLLTGQQVSAAGLTGVLGALFSLGGGHLAKRLGIGDVDTLLAGGIKPNQVAAEIASMPAKSIPRKVIEGAITEGFLEELPQSSAEQILQNLALGKDWNEDLDEAMVMGVLSGMTMGAGASSFGGNNAAPEVNPLAPTAEPVQTSPAPSEAPVDQPLADPVSAAAPSFEAAPQPVAPTQSQAMGIDPNAGPMSTAAAMAVDSGATQNLADQAALQQAAELATKAQKQKTNTAEQDGVDPLTGEILADQAQQAPVEPIDRATELQEKIDYIRQQAKGTGWNRGLMEAREAAEQELAAIQPKQAEMPLATTADPVKAADAVAPTSVQEGIKQAQTEANLNKGVTTPQPIQQTESTANVQQTTEAEQAGTQRTQATGTQSAPESASAEVAKEQSAADSWRAMSEEDRKAVAAKTDIPAIPRKNIHKGEWDVINPHAQAKLTAAMSELQQEVAESKPKPETKGKRLTKEEEDDLFGVDKKRASAIERIDAGKAWFGSEKKAKEFVKKSGIAETHEVVANGKRFDIKAKQTEQQVSGYEAAKKAVADADARMTAAGKVMDKFETGSNGLTPDAVKSTPEWQAAYAESNAALKQLQDANKAMVKDYANESREDRNAVRQAKLDASKASETDQSSAPSIEGKPIDKDWAEFSKESGTKGIPRAEMPQIKAEHRGAMVNFLNARGIQHQEDNVPASSLKPTQAEFSRDKVDKAKGYEGGNRSILVSEDGHVLDGHHQWMAARENGEDVKVIRLSAPISELLEAAKEFPSSTVDKATASAIVEKTGVPADKIEVVTVGDKPKKQQAAPKEETAAKDAERFSGNKLFTASAVEAARARMKSKLGQLNSGIDPELLVDGMTIAGAYIESGVRKFSDYAKAMVEDLGDGVKPYLLSFWEGARNYPGLDTEGMTSPTVSNIQFKAMTSKEQATEIAPEAVGVVAEKPTKRTKKTGARGDMVLTQDWGTEQINGYGDGQRETGNDTKDAFLKEARNYLNAVSDSLRSFGFEPHLDRKGKASKPVSANEGGAAGSGDVSLTMRNQDTGENVYITVGESSLRGVVPTTDSGIAIMYRMGVTEDQYATREGNTWAPVDLSASDLAALVSKKSTVQRNEAGNEQLTDGDAGQGRAQEVRGRGRAPQQGNAQADTGNVEAGQPTNAPATSETGDSGRSSVREPRKNVATGGGVQQGGDAVYGRQRASGEGAPDAGAGTTRADAGRAAKLTSPAGAKMQAKDLHIENPLEIVGGTPVQRFNRNQEALELLQTLTEDGRQATAEEQRVLAGYIGWGSFGQELFQGSWEHPKYQNEGVWKQRGEWLRDALGESAWKSAQRSITNAHYTDPPTVMAMWDMVRRMGFDGGRVLEPAMGTGNFFSMMPADLKARSELTGIELDETTGAIAKQLFPKSNVRVMGYQDSKTPDNFYDVVIGNWPFENTPVADRRYNKFNPMLHDYFFLKAMDQVRPGGIVIGITSAGSMDKQNTIVRRELAKQAELITSIRLPSGAFENYAGTSVVTDIVVMRKRPEKLAVVAEDAVWTETAQVDTPSGTQVRVNQFYQENPSNIIGTLDFGHGTTSFREGMIVRRPENMEQRLKDAISLVPEGAIQARTQIDHLTYYANESSERHGSLANVNGKLMIASGDQLVEANEVLKYQIKDEKKSAARENSLKDAVQLRTLHSALVNAERAGNSADKERKVLKKSYMDYVADHGKLRESFALTYMRRIQDPFFAELAALENDDGTPAAVMQRSTTRSKKTIENPSVRDAYVLARNQSVNPTIEQIAEISGKDAEQIRSELLDSGAVFEGPNGDIVPSDIYLSGNVREKMREAQAALNDGNKAMSVNVQALKDVMPEDVPYFNIETKLGATWVPPSAYSDYIAHMLARKDPEGIDVSFQSGRWKVRFEKGLNKLPEAATNYGTDGVSFSQLVQAAISNQVLRLKSRDVEGNEYVDTAKSEAANARIAKIREDFSAWLWSDAERRQTLEIEYNEVRNAWATPKYDGSFLTFEGMALTLGRGEFNLREHQVNAIWRAIVNRRSLNAHEVGTGKTFTMGGIAIESRRYGIAKKPVILAHNANSATVAAEIRMMYPSSRVLYIDNLDAKNRAVRLRQIANDDWDAIVIPHSLIDSLSLREETLMQMAADDIAALEQELRDAAEEDGASLEKINLDDDDDIKKIRSVTAKELAKARKRIIESIKKQAQQSSKEGAINFEDLGIDMILVDEVHEFKKPPIVTRMQMKGLNTQTSGRSIALQFLTRYVRQMNSGGNVHTFTGTPITNTITEIYHQMRYVMESEMADANVSDWDGWFGSFATEVQDVELSSAGEYEMVTRLAGFVNVPELRQMVGQYMDTVFADDMPEMQPREVGGKSKEDFTAKQFGALTEQEQSILNAKGKINGKQLSDPSLTDAERAQLLNGRTENAMDRPYKKVVNESSDMTEAQLEVFNTLQQYAQDWRNADARTRKEWMQSGDPRSPLITEGIASKASFDARLLDESLAGMEGKTQDHPNSKASRVVNNVLDIYKSHPKAGQVIFSDSGVHKSTRRTRTVGGEKVSETVKIFSTMHDVIERLVQGGIPREQIALVTGNTSKEARKEIALAVNEGRIRVVIGSTDTLGVGVNMQKNLRAMHHMDAPYMPGELEQRNGRGQRQGNQWNTVLEYRYMTDRLDGRRWQILAVKQRFITSFMKAKADSARVIEGEAAADEQSDILESFSEAAGDARILQRVKLQKKMESLQRKERLYTQGIADMRGQVRRSTREAEERNDKLARIEKDKVLENISSLIANQQQGFTAQIGGSTYNTRKDATDALQEYIDKNVRLGSKEQVIGSYAGHPVSVDWPGFADSPTTTIKAFGRSFEGKGIVGAEARMRNFPKTVQVDIEERDKALATVENMRSAMDQPFGQAKDLERTKQQLEDLEADLSLNPVPPPAWLRQGAPIDSEVYSKGKPYVVTGHRYSQDGWFVLAEDAKGETVIPYAEATDNVGMPIYDEREFAAPEVNVKKSGDEVTEADRVPSDAPKFSFAGRKAQGADLMSLSTAQQRIASGESAETVRQETGWHRGADGKWRFEISDNAAKLSQKGATFADVHADAYMAASLDNRKAVTVGDMLDHPQLFAAYPKLKDIPVSLMPEGTTATARLQRRATGTAIQVRGDVPSTRVVSVLMHELQHGIQTIEGFAVGGSKKNLISEMDPTGTEAYKRLAGEVEARNTQTRLGMNDEFRQLVSPEQTADTANADVVVTFNGKDVVKAPKPENVQAKTGAGFQGFNEQSLVRAFDIQFPKLTPAVKKMLARGKRGEKGGVVVLSSADPLIIAGAFSRKTGRSLSDSVQMFSDAGTVNGFFDPKSGLTFLVGPNLNPVTGTAVLLHEMTHGQQKQKIDQRAMDMLMNRGKLKNADLRAFLDRVANRMVDAGETSNGQEAAAYIVEQAVIEGRSEGYMAADSRFLSWVDSTIGKQVGNFLRSVLANVRQFMLRNGMPIVKITVDDLVSYAMAGMEQASRGNVDGGAAGFSRDVVTNTPNFKRWFGKSKVVGADGKPLTVSHGSGATFTIFDKELLGTTTGAESAKGGFFFTSNPALSNAFRRDTEGSNVDLKALRQMLMDADQETLESIGKEWGYNLDWDLDDGREFYADRVVEIYESDVSLNSTYDDNSGMERILKKHFGKEFFEPGMVVNAYLKIEDPYIVVFDEDADQFDEGAITNAIKKARQEGRDGVILKNMIDAAKTDDKGNGGVRSDVYVVFEPNQIKSATDNNGDFDGNNPDIRFSRSGFKGFASKATSELNKTFSAPGKLSKWHTTVGTMNNLAQRSQHFKPVFEAAQGFIDDVAYYAADAAELAGKLLPKLETWKDIAKKPISAADNAAIEKPINEGTLVWTRDASGKPVRVESLAESSASMSTEEKARELMSLGLLEPGMNNAWKGQSESQYATLIDSRYESQLLKAGIVWTQQELRSMFGLTDEQVGLYKEFRAAVDRSLDTMGRADMLRFGGKDLKPLRDAVMDQPDIQSAARFLIEQLGEMAQEDPDRETQLMQTAHGIVERATKVAELQAEGYAPLSRFGKYTVDVLENGERQYFGLFETAREANDMAEKMRAEFGTQSVTQGTLSDESYKLFAGITPESLELFGNMLGLDSDGDTAQDQAFQEYLRLTKTNRSAMRRLIHRKGIAGFSSDVGRVLASFVYSNARQTSAGLNMGDLGDAITDIPKQQGELTDVAVRLAEYIKNPQEEAQAVRGLLFAQYLGGSVASAFVNITQPFAVTFPWLSQHGGAKRAAAELARAAKDMSTKGKKYEADLAVALKDAEDDGTVSPQEVHQLMAQARGAGSLAAGDGTKLGEARAAASNSVARLSLAWGKMFGAAEQVNRRVTFIAAYRVARNQNMSDPAAFAREAVQETQFIYSKANKMQWGRGAVGGTLMTFKTYSIAYVELMHRLWNQGEKGSPERKEGRKAAMLMVATLMLMGGAGGLPFAEDAEDLIDGAAQLMGYNFSARKAKEQFLIDVFGDALAEFVDKGVSGLPGSPMDVSGRLGLGNLIPGTGLFTERTSHSRDLLEIAGPAGDFASRILSGTKKVLGGNVGSGVTEFMPTAVRNAMKGVDMASTGMYRDTKGYNVLETTHLEAALKAMGFQPSGVSKVQEANWLNQREKNFYSMKAQEIRAQWAAGIFEKDGGKVQAARDAVDDWNRKNPDQRIVIRIPDVMRRVREMAKSKDQRIADTAPKAMRARMREESARMREELN